MPAPSRAPSTKNVGGTGHPPRGGCGPSALLACEQGWRPVSSACERVSAGSLPVGGVRGSIDRAHRRTPGSRTRGRSTRPARRRRRRWTGRCSRELSPPGLAAWMASGLADAGPRAVSGQALERDEAQESTDPVPSLPAGCEARETDSRWGFKASKRACRPFTGELEGSRRDASTGSVPGSDRNGRRDPSSRSVVLASCQGYGSARR